MLVLGDFLDFQFFLFIAFKADKGLGLKVLFCFSLDLL